MLSISVSSEIMKNIIILVCLIIFPALVSSAEYGNKDIKQIQVYSTGGVAFTTIQTIEGPSSCTNKIKYVLKFGSDGVNAMYSALLSAKATSNKVSLQVSDTECHSTYPVVTRVILQ